MNIIKMNRWKNEGDISILDSCLNKERNEEKATIWVLGWSHQIPKAFRLVVRSSFFLQAITVIGYNKSPDSF